MYKFAFRNLLLKKSRTALAMTGLIIAIMGIVSLVSISAGIRYELDDVVSKMEGITIMQKGVFDDSQSRVSLDFKEKLEAFPESKVVLPVVSGIAIGFEGGGGIKMEPMGGMVGFAGIDTIEANKLEKGTMYNPELLAGRMLKSSDKNGVMLGASLAEDYKKSIGSKVRMNNRDFKVVGIFTSGSKMMDKMMVFINIKTAQELAGRDENIVNMFYIEAKNPRDVEKLTSRINFKFEDDDIEATSGSGFGEQIGSLLNNFDIFFIGVSSIALLVGAVGILNTMLMSVKDRTREFGILKAVGWASDDVVKLVLYESFFLGVIGGVIGLILSVLAVSVIDPFLPFRMHITPELLAYSFTVAVVLGVIGGVYPAWKVSKLDPIEAIRNE